MLTARSRSDPKWLAIHLALLCVGLCGSVGFSSEPLTPCLECDFDEPASESIKVHGKVDWSASGPRPEEFPEFDSGNMAAAFKGGYLEIADTGPNSPFDFDHGDAITIEAWVRLDGVPTRGPMYIVGKGRSKSPRFKKDNQNWALRVTVDPNDIARIGFLFATPQPNPNTRFHRWTSRKGFVPASGWHHIAVQYRFGKPESIRGWIDGQPTIGTWDLAGPTGIAPVMDDDSIFIGSSMNGNKGNTFRGWIDEIKVHRQYLDADQLRDRFQRVGGPQIVAVAPASMPEIDAVVPDRVTYLIHESMPAHDRWLYTSETWPAETMRWSGTHFLLPRIPLRYDDWGIRDQWRSPVLLRAVADVELPNGSLTFLLRARGLSRLWIDGTLVAETEADTIKPPDGEEPITLLAQPPAVGMRVAGYHQQEVTGRWQSDHAGIHRVVLEIVVGGPGRRTETGEVVVAFQQNADGPFRILAPQADQSVTMSDDVVRPLLRHIENSLVVLDQDNRRRRAASQDEFWRRRHQFARQWVQQQWNSDLPKPGGEMRVAAPSMVDRLIQAKIDRAVAKSNRFDEQTTLRFYENVLPILREHCFDCHGPKSQGGLRLDTRAFAVQGGDSGDAAIVPGDAHVSALITRVRSSDPHERMPPVGDPLTESQTRTLEQWIDDGAPWPPRPIDPQIKTGVAMTGDAAFLRRIYLDLIGVAPDEQQTRRFLESQAPDKRDRLIDQLLRDPGWADHWVSQWMDWLAENPTLINQSLNSSGPFRWFLYESLYDRKPLDRMVTELILMRGGADEGGSAGFAQAGENDVPMAEKAHIVASAFLAVEMQCARCHDAPYHPVSQQDLFALAAMLQRKPIDVPASSRVPIAFFQSQPRQPLIEVTLDPDAAVQPVWPLRAITNIDDSPSLDPLVHDPSDPRARLAALVTAPQNTRFARVFVNRIWRQLMGAGFVEPVHDWEGRLASHPELLDWLAHDFVMHGYDVPHLIRRIVTSDAYQRAAVGHNRDAGPSERFFYAPDRRRMSAEQVVDSFHAVTGRPMEVEELTFVHDGRRPLGKRQTLGRPRRAWMFASLNNERDRPSLSLPAAQTVVDVLEAFGWNGARQRPIHERPRESNVLQPGILANGTLTQNLTRASVGSSLAVMAMDAESPEQLVDRLFLQILSRYPKPPERQAFTLALAAGFKDRIVPEEEIEWPSEAEPLPLVTWFNHLRPDASRIQLERQRRVQTGPLPDPRLESAWRQVYEDVVWSLVNHREFVWVP